MRPRSRLLTLITACVTASGIVIAPGIAAGAPAPVAPATPACGVEQSNTGYNGEQPTDPSKPSAIRDKIEKLPAIPKDMNVSDPFYLLADYVSYKEEEGQGVTSDELVNKFSESQYIVSIAQNLVHLNQGDTWLNILTAYSVTYDTERAAAIRSALYRLKDQATKCARSRNMPTGELLEPNPEDPRDPQSGTIGGGPPTPEPVKLTINVPKATIGDSEAIINAQGGRGGQIFIRNLNDAGDGCWSGQIINTDDVTITVSRLTPGSPYEFELVSSGLTDEKTVATTTGPSPKQTKSERLKHDQLALMGSETMAAFLSIAAAPKETAELIAVLGVTVAKYLASKDSKLEESAKIIDLTRLITDGIPAEALTDPAVEMVEKQMKKIAEDVEPCHFDSIVQR